MNRDLSKNTTSSNIPEPWEKLTTYTTSGEVFEEYFMNPQTNEIVNTIHEILEKNRENYQFYQTLDQIKKMVEEERQYD